MQRSRKTSAWCMDFVAKSISSERSSYIVVAGHGILNRVPLLYVNNPIISHNF